MNWRIPALAAVFAANGVLTFAQEVPQEIPGERVAEFVALIVANGCTMNERIAGEVLPKNGFTEKSETKAIVGQLMQVGAAELRGGALVLTGGACQGDGDTETLRVRFLAFVEERGCSITFEDAKRLLPEAGFVFSDVDNLVDELMDEGVVSVSDPNQTLSIKTEKCS